MIKVSMPDGAIKEFDKNDAELLPILRHTAAHVLAYAVEREFPGAKLAIGPSIDNGFYYDIAFPKPISPEVFPMLEKRMKEIINAKHPITNEELSIKDALELFQDCKYKTELINDLKEGGANTISIYRMGDFVDLCKGPHLPTTGYLDERAFKLLSVAGAYWRGNSANDMLTRIYGTAFPTKAALDGHLHMLEEAAKRDHRKLGREMDLFHFEPEYAPGGVFWHPKGWTMFQMLVEYMRRRQTSEGYIEISTPAVCTRKTFETSGHWQMYAEHMYYAKVRDDDADFGIKPVSCPGGMLYFKQGIKSYRDLPLKVAEFGKVNRFEASGALFGLMRVREFTQDDAHIFCTPEQLEDECVKVVKLIMDIYKEFGFDGVRIKLSTRPETRLGTDEIWDASEKALSDALSNNGFEYAIFPGEGAIYGPKLEFVLVDSLGRDWQCGTLQLDMNLPERFDIHYIDRNGEKQRPIMLHRALFGSLERFMGILIEHYAGHMPLWLSPIQVVVASISEEAEGYAKEVETRLGNVKIRASADIRADKIGYKVREHSLAKVPYIAVVGRKESEAGLVSIRALGGEKEESMTLDAFVEKLKSELR